MQVQTDKKIVSKEEYIKRVVTRTSIGTVAGTLLVVSGLTSMLSALLLIWLLGSVLQHNYPLVSLIVANEIYSLPFNTADILLLGLITVSYITFRLGQASIRHAAHIKAGVPLTRANTADLPAPESLVRASTEPLQAQKAVLLRAAGEGQEKHEEQLVRASVGQN